MGFGWDTSLVWALASIVGLVFVIVGLILIS